ncbi:MAG: phage Gp37/Gp68 family protein [Bacteroidetes bacterium]|nr:phage Gp37/Gp68 family protein [Bacteroidota bacterium]
MTELKTQNKTKIEWADQTWNPLGGCTEISSGCKNCYAKVEHEHLCGITKQIHYSKPFNEIHEREELLERPFKWKKQLLVFVCSMSDLFHKDVSDEFIKKVFNTMNSSWHKYLVLTKRSDRLKELAPSLTWTPNITAGVTVESSRYKPRIDDLRHVPADNRFLSCEPLIGDLGELTLDGISWVITGGESGRSLKKLRKIKKDWVISIQAQCKKENIPFLFKQWGHADFNPNPNDPTIKKYKGNNGKDGSAKGGRQLNGKIYNEFPDFSEYWGIMPDDDLQNEINKIVSTVKSALKDFSQSWITIGKSLNQIQQIIDDCAEGEKRSYWRTYLGVDSFQDYCHEKLQFSRETATQMRQAFSFVQTLKPELLDGNESEIPSYTKLRLLGPHIDEIKKDLDEYSEIVEAVFDNSKTRTEAQKVVREVFPPAKLSKDSKYWENYITQFENKIVKEVDESKHDKLKSLVSKIKDLLD